MSIFWQLKYSQKEPPREESVCVCRIASFHKWQNSNYLVNFDKEITANQNNTLKNISSDHMGRRNHVEISDKWASTVYTERTQSRNF